MTYLFVLLPVWCITFLWPHYDRDCIDYFFYAFEELRIKRIFLCNISYDLKQAVSLSL